MNLYIEATTYPDKNADYKLIKNWFESREITISPTKLGYYLIGLHDTFKTHFNEIGDKIMSPGMRLKPPKELESHIGDIYIEIVD